MNEHTLYIVTLLLALSVVSIVILKRFRLPAILGYLFVGIAVGPHSLGLVESDQSVLLLAEIGVVFLLFSIGLEFSLAQLISMRHGVLGLGTAQVFLTTLIGILVAHFMGISWEGSVVVGGAIALSSTAIVAKQLVEQLEMNSRHGRLAMGALLFQDLAVVPFLVVIPILAGHGDNSVSTELSFALAKAIAAFTIMSALGRWVLRPVFHTVAAAHSSELFTLTVLLIALTAGAITHLLGLSPAMGAFLAGIMLGETEYRHQIETDIRPFRDVLMALFFITIGIQLDVLMLPLVWLNALILLFVLVIGKGLLVALIAMIMGNPNGVAIRTGLVLAQGGEFGFAILALALSSHLISPLDSQAILAAIIVSMIIAPILIRENGAIAKRLSARSYMGERQARARSIFGASRELRDHVIVVGFGRIGQNLVNFIREEGFEYVALDLDPILVREAHDAGERVYYGDATHVSMLRAAGIMRARALVLTSSDPLTAERIIHTARSRNKDVPILVRTEDDLYLEDLEGAGASRVVPESIESSMMLATHLMELLDVPADEILYLIEKARSDHYHRLRGYFHGNEAESVEEMSLDSHRLHTVVLPPECPSIGKTIEQLALDHHGARIISIRRGDIRGEDPEPDTALMQGDSLVLEGTAESLQKAEEILLRGN